MELQQEGGPHVPFRARQDKLTEPNLQTNNMANQTGKANCHKCLCLTKKYMHDSRPEDNQPGAQQSSFLPLPSPLPAISLAPHTRVPSGTRTPSPPPNTHNLPTCPYTCPNARAGENGDIGKSPVIHFTSIQGGRKAQRAGNAAADTVTAHHSPAG